MKILKKFFSTKSIILSAMLFLAFLSSNLPGFCAGTLTALSCGVPSPTAAWPRNTFTTTCTMNVTMGGDTDLKIGVYTGDYTTTKNSGNGSNITYTSPEHRFKALGPKQAGTPANITTGDTGGTSTIVRDSITTDQTGISVDLKYTTYEADYGGTEYTQPFTFALYRDNNAAIDTSGSQMTFTIENKQYIHVTTDPTITLTGSSQVFSINQYFDSNTMTAEVRANNTWKLRTELLGVPTDGGKTIPKTSTYFKASGSGFENLATTRTQFADINTYYDVAQNTDGTNRTGTTDNINLDPVNVVVTNSLKTLGTMEQAYDVGTYHCDSRFQVISPR